MMTTAKMQENVAEKIDIEKFVGQVLNVILHYYPLVSIS